LRIKNDAPQFKQNRAARAPAFALRRRFASTWPHTAPQQTVWRDGVRKLQPHTAQIFLISRRRGWLRAEFRQSSEQYRGGRPARGMLAEKLVPHGQRRASARPFIGCLAHRKKTNTKNQRHRGRRVARNPRRSGTFDCFEFHLIAESYGCEKKVRE